MNLFSINKSGRFVVVFVVLAMVAMTSVPVFGQSRNAPALAGEKTGYALGVTIGRNMKDLGLDIDPDMIVRGIRDTVRGKPVMSDQDIRAALDQYEKEISAKLGDKNRREGEAFLRENKQRKGIVTLPSGLQYIILKEGKGPVPKPTDLVTLHYRAKMVDGTEFESSYWNNKPAEIPVNQTIKGWGEALVKMPTGSIWRLFIPAELAYGQAGAGPTIGPNAVIICDLELLGVK